VERAVDEPRGLTNGVRRDGEEPMTNEWFYSEAFWRAGYPFMFSPEAFEAAKSQVAQILTLTGIRAGRALDLGCGPGRHAVPLAESGLRVTGVDASAFLLERARANAAQSHVEIECVHQDMRTFVRPNSFDLAISLFSSFGYFEHRDEDRQVAANLMASLAPGGALVIDLMSKELTGRFLDVRVTEADGVTRVERHQIVDNWTRIKSEWIMIRDERAERFHYAVRIYAGQELLDLLHSVGFTDVTLHGDFDGRLYGPKGTRLIAVARKAVSPASP
jgi:2-polyprenyl-3-methyl-5-hydroxy-6-metoxy-1,4-benzoquinol methylase